MIRVCYRCHKVFGEKEPLDDKSVTSGICEECWPLEQIEIRIAQKKLRDAGWKPYRERSG